MGYLPETIPRFSISKCTFLCYTRPAFKNAAGMNPRDIITAGADFPLRVI